MITFSLAGDTIVEIDAEYRESITAMAQDYEALAAMKRTLSEAERHLELVEAQLELAPLPDPKVDPTAPTNAAQRAAYIQVRMEADQEWRGLQRQLTDLRESIWRADGRLHVQRERARRCNALLLLAAGQTSDVTP